MFSVYNSKFGNYVECVYSIELRQRIQQIQQVYLIFYVQLDIDNEGRLITKRYNKRDDFSFPIVNFPFLCSNIAAVPAY